MKVKVISRCTKREGGKPTAEYYEPGTEVEMDDPAEVHRLITAKCIVPIKEEAVETEIMEAPENQMRRRKRKVIQFGR